MVFWAIVLFPFDGTRRLHVMRKEQGTRQRHTFILHAVCMLSRGIHLVRNGGQQIKHNWWQEIALPFNTIQRQNKWQDTNSSQLHEHRKRCFYISIILPKKTATKRPTGWEDKSKLQLKVYFSDQDYVPREISCVRASTLVQCLPSSTNVKVWPCNVIWKICKSKG